MAQAPVTQSGIEIALHEAIHGGIVNTADLARKLAALYIASAYGDEALARQGPLNVSELDDSWIIRGGVKGRRHELGAATVQIMKLDGQVLQLNIPLHLNDAD